ncbi:MAG: histidinol-phosphate aminotransferase family protein [Candidatus Omnitrophica bacterium]|nr:histidinol-phosphate aminotransferase family protein [Candidatus Omnitrophota bacterium]
MKKNLKLRLEMLERTRVGAYRDVSSGLYLDRNERVVPFDKETMHAICDRIARSNFNLYPDIMPFYDRLASWLGIGKERLYITEGVSGAIKSLIESIASPGDNIIFPLPTFALYPVYCRMFGVDYKTFGYTSEYRLDIEKMMSLLDEKTSFLFIPNPNVPIEGTLGTEEMRHIAKRCLENNTFFVVDEVYFEFGPPGAMKLIDEFENIFIMRSFSKAFGLAGIRLGYLIGPARYIDYVSKTRTGYETNTLSMAVAGYFLENYHIVKNYVKDIRDGLEYLKGELDALGVEHNGGEASNFLYIEMHSKKRSADVVEGLRLRKVYVRGGWPAPYDTGFSVTAAPRPIMEIFVSQFRDTLMAEDPKSIR